MTILESLGARWVYRQGIALQSFFRSRPRLDISVSDEGYGQRSLGISAQQKVSEPIPVNMAVYEMEFYWDTKIHIKNNSSKTAYGIKIEKIYQRYGDYVGSIDPLAALRELEELTVDYKLKHRAAYTGAESQAFIRRFPGHLEEIEIILSYTNEARRRYYTRFTWNRQEQKNEHLFRQPKGT